MSDSSPSKDLLKNFYWPWVVISEFKEWFLKEMN